jgi:hypothetical protein
MKAYCKDLRRKIVEAIERGMSKAQAARTFGVGISTVKRYATKAQKGEPLEPGKAPGKPPKIDERINKLLVEDLQERPFVTLRRALRVRGGHKRGFGEPLHDVPRHSSDRFPRVKRGAKRLGARRVPEGRLAGDGGRYGRPSRLVFVDEMGLHTSLAPFMVTRREASACASKFRETVARTPPFWPPSP